MASDGRIRDERFCQDRQRAIDYSPHFADRTGLVVSGSVYEQRLFDIIRRMGSGDLLPENAYRRGIGRDHDELLDVYGIKHLHLDEGGGDILLFLVEYADRVLLLEINSHRHFASKPPGAILRSLHDSALRHADQQVAADGAAKRAGWRRALFGDGD